MDYAAIRKLRKLIIDELRSEFPVFLPEHYQLAEMRLQTIILAGLDEKGVEKEKLNWKKNGKN